jgi:alkaline phosphatase D
LPIINTNAVIYFSSLIIQGLISRKRTTRQFKSPLATLLLGRYDPSSSIATTLTVFINVLCFGAAVDFVYRGQTFHQNEIVTFSRIGYVGSTDARIVARSSLAETLQIEYRESTTSVWHTGPVISVDETSDFVGVFILNGLKDSTLYSYRTNANHLGSFRTQSPTAEKWSMVSSSSLSPFFPYNPLSHALRLPEFEHLSKLISSRQIDFMLFLGDFIYIDLPLRFGFDTSDHRTAYRKIYASPSWSDDLLTLPWLHTYDDHEITNDWASNDTGLYQNAIPPWKSYQQSGNPQAFREGVNYYSFKKGDVSFFVLDTRRYRSEEAMEDGPHKTMLGEQ